MARFKINDNGLTCYTANKGGSFNAIFSLVEENFSTKVSLLQKIITALSIAFSYTLQENFTAFLIAFILC